MIKITLSCVTCNIGGSFRSNEEKDKYDIGGILELICKGSCNGRTAHRIDNVADV